MNTQPAKSALIFSLTYFPFIVGAEVALREITARIEDIRFDLITARLDRDLPFQEKIGKVIVWRVGVGRWSDKYFYPFRAFLLSLKLHRKYNYDFIWAMMASWAGISALIFKLTHPRIKYLLTEQSGDSDEFIRKRTWFWLPVYKLIYKRADYVQTISQWLADRARKYGYRGQISVIPNGVDLQKIRQRITGNFQVQIKRNFNIPEEHKIILTVSRLVEKNDVASLIRAVHILATEHKLPATLIIAGAGKLEIDLKNLTKTLNFVKHVIFLGNIKHPEVLKYYAAADIFSRPSLSEGLGVSFIEAMGAGVPVIATPVGGIPDFLRDGETGLFCAVKNPHDLAYKIKQLLEDRELYERIRENGLKLVKEKYDWDIIARNMKEIMEKL